MLLLIFYNIKQYFCEERNSIPLIIDIGEINSGEDFLQTGGMILRALANLEKKAFGRLLTTNCKNPGADFSQNTSMDRERIIENGKKNI